MQPPATGDEPHPTRPDPASAENLAHEPATVPVDPADPRFVGAEPPGALPPRPRRLVRSGGPASDAPPSPAERVLRVVLPVVFFGALATVALVFFLALRPGPQRTVVGPEGAVRAAITERPRRVCFNDNNPCAWLTVVGDQIVAFNTSGPLPQEFGREGVSWCASSGYFGANATGSRYDQRGLVVTGPAPRSLDRFRVVVDAQQRLVVDWLDLRAGLRAYEVTEVTPPYGPDCDEIPFDREADLDL